MIQHAAEFAPVNALLGNIRKPRVAPGFLHCMAWAGTAVLYNLSGGVAHSQMIHPAAHHPAGGLSFVQISDSHIGFRKEANPDVVATLQHAVGKINALPRLVDLDP